MLLSPVVALPASAGRCRLWVRWASVFFRLRLATQTDNVDIATATSEPIMDATSQPCPCARCPITASLLCAEHTGAPALARMSSSIGRASRRAIKPRPCLFGCGRRARVEVGPGDDVHPDAQRGLQSPIQSGQREQGRPGAGSEVDQHVKSGVPGAQPSRHRRRSWGWREGDHQRDPTKEGSTERQVRLAPFTVRRPGLTARPA